MIEMGGTPSKGTPADKRIAGRGQKPGPKRGSHNTKKKGTS